MEAVPESPNPLDRALALAQETAALLARADADATAAYRDALRRVAGAPLALRRMREEQAAIAARLVTRLTPTLDATWVELAELDARFGAADRAVATAAWRAEVLPWFLRVPLVRRSLDKPLGYPGDYGMVQIIFDEPDDAADPLGRALARYTADVGPCRAHRQRRPWALGHLEEVRAATRGPLKVVSYACGPEHTLRAFVGSAPDTIVHLYDTEPRALQWCRDRFAQQGHGGRLHTHTLLPGELVDGSADVLAAAPADVVLVLGLFDYLTPDAVGALVDRLVSVLVPGGRLLCTNVHTTNPWRAFMEYVGAWQVRHRGLGELAAMVVRERADLRVVEACLDDTGTNAFVAVERRVGL